MIISSIGGAHGVRDHRAILSLESFPKQKAFGKELYPAVFHKAALYARNIIINHPFIDGNKRTGMIVADAFLKNNGYKISAKPGEIEKFAISIVIKRHGVEEIARWLKKHSRKI